MPVNGIELKEGQIWKTKNYGVVTLSDRGVNAHYPWRMNFPNNGDPIGSITIDGKHWENDEMPELLECIYNPEEYGIREVIPQSSEVTDDKKEEVKEEPRYKAATAEQPLYTVDEVFDAIFEVTKHLNIDPPWDYIDDVKEYLSRIKDPQYLEYLRLKAIYE